MTTVSMTVNGKAVSADVEDRMLLVEFLREHHCHQVQGYYYSPAIPLQQLPRFVQELRQKRQGHLIS